MSLEERSLDSRFEQHIIKEYELWTLLINEDQAYLGRSIAWLARPGDMQRMSQLRDEEILELLVVIREHERAVEKLWQPAHMNDAWLGNYVSLHGGHGHMHLIPRYTGSRKLGTLIFSDSRWEMKLNYTPQRRRILSNRSLFRIRDMIKDAINGTLTESIESDK
jgi:diadenosine tetraphosphate (Ap4A) HIT family hydrolase